MIPILFKPKTTDFTTNGIGRLSDAISCYVTEERNGLYELEMKYPVDGIFYKDIGYSSVVYAENGNKNKAQPFEVYKISKPLNGIVTICARHISYQLSYIPCSPFSATGVAEALQGLKDNAAIACDFEFWTDKVTAADFAVKVPSSIRSKLGGNQGSILDVYGGEYEFDAYTVKLHANRGSNNGVVLRYGKNITDLKQEENIENTVTGIYPYWSDTEGNVVTLPEKVVMSDNSNNFPHTRVIPIDFTQEFDSVPTESDLRNKTTEYIKAHNIGVPSVNISVSFELLWQTEGYKDIAPLEKVGLCDIVSVEYEKLGVNAEAKVIKTIYDTLKGKYKSIEVGEARSTLASTIVAQEKKLEEKPSKGFLDAAVKNATNWITGANGGYVIFHKNANGQPYEILIMDTPDITTAVNVWRWNMNGWGYSNNGYNGPYNMAATIDGGFVADFITAGTMLANRIKGGTLTLGGKDNGNGSMKILDAEGNEVGSWDKDGIVATSGELAGWKIEKGQIVKSINLYNDMSATGLASVANDAPVQYWVWMRKPTSATTAVFFVGYKTKSNYLNNVDSITPYFRVRTNGEFLSSIGKIGRWNFTDRYFTGYKKDGKTQGFGILYDPDNDRFIIDCDYNIEAGNKVIGKYLYAWKDAQVDGELTVNKDLWAMSDLYAEKNIACSGTVYASNLVNTSKAELKKNFRKLENAWDIINAIDIYKYNYKTEEDGTKEHIGLVIGDGFKYSEEVTSKENEGVDTYSLISVCVKAIQEQQHEIEKLKELLKGDES